MVFRAAYLVWSLRYFHGTQVQDRLRDFGVHLVSHSILQNTNNKLSIVTTGSVGVQAPQLEPTCVTWIGSCRDIWEIRIMWLNGL